MAVPKHYIIPIFIPELGCPHRCVFCNQCRISGKQRVPELWEVGNVIERHLATIPLENSHIEIGFFGGNFTGINRNLQEQYLSIASRFLSLTPHLSPPASPFQTELPSSIDRIKGIRISTRPDYIDEEQLALLKEHGVSTIELGAQSMDDEVLMRSGRGHTVADTERASIMILRNGFRLGLQMMLGLPGDTFRKSVHTARRIIALGADNTRIYPTLVIRDTELAALYENGEYKPLSLAEAVQWSVEIFTLFEKAGISILRIGLHPSEGLISGRDLVAGPYHASFRELVATEIWKRAFRELLNVDSAGRVSIHVAPDQYNVAVGYRAGNQKLLLEKFSTVKFVKDGRLTGRAFYADHH